MGSLHCKRTQTPPPTRQPLSLAVPSRASGPNGIFVVALHPHRSFFFPSDSLLMPKRDFGSATLLSALRRPHLRLCHRSRTPPTNNIIFVSNLFSAFPVYQQPPLVHLTTRFYCARTVPRTLAKSTCSSPLTSSSTQKLLYWKGFYC